jgi:hypothetical protein
MQYNYHCNRVVILNLELVQFWLFLAAFVTSLTIVSNIKKKPQTFIYITLNIPVTAQKYRCEMLYEGPQDDACATGKV